MKRLVVGFLALLLTAAALQAAGLRILLVARDLEEHPLSGFRFAYAGVETMATNRAGATQIDLPSDHRTGQQIKLYLLVPASKKAEEWFLVNPQINIPTGTAPAEVVMMRRSGFRQLAAEARDASRQAAPEKVEVTEEDRKRALVEAAARYGLSAEQLETALRSFAETQDPKDQGIAAYLKGEYSQAEDLLEKAVEKKERDFVETLRYLGSSQYEQGKYRAAADTFRKALALRGEDTILLSWLGGVLQAQAEWAEAEPLMRRTLAIAEKSFGPEHPEVAIHLNNLAQLLKDMNRLAEAESLMRLALAIDEKSFGQDHPKVARDLNNLALLLKDTNRLAEAEPLMRHALAIDEKSFGQDHPKVAMRLNNLAQILQDTNRLAEAEPLMRRALTIDEKSFGSEHPNVSTGLNNLALLLQATNRLAEAEPLMRRALAIFEKSFGPDHPNVAIELSNLAFLLQSTNRLAEAEPLIRRALSIFLKFERRTGHQHPFQEIAAGNYRRLLQKMGKSEAEIEATINALAPGGAILEKK